MTAPATQMSSMTAKMLAEIGVGTASELIMGVRYNTSPPGPAFVPELDTHLLEARYHPGGSSLRRGDLVELTGPSGGGKTSFALFLVSTTLLPASMVVPLDYPRHSQRTIEVTLGGRAARAAFLAPPAHRSPLPTLVASMRAHIETCVTAALAAGGFRQYGTDAPAVQAVIAHVMDGALARLSVLRPRPTALGWTLALRRVLFFADGDGDDEGADLVVCDGFADGFWPTRWAEETRNKFERERDSADAGAGEGERHRMPSILPLVRGADDAGFTDVWDAVTALRRERGAIVVITLQGLRPIPNTPFFRPQLPHPYPSPFIARATTNANTPEPAWPLSMQITLPGPVRHLQLPAETLLADALRERDRMPLTDVQVFDGVVRVPGGGGAAGTMEGARFAFGIAAHGLVPFAKDD